MVVNTQSLTYTVVCVVTLEWTPLLTTRYTTADIMLEIFSTSVIVE